MAWGRHLFPPWGAAGGRDGSPNYVQVVRADGHAEPPIGKASRLLLHRGDLVRLVTGSGGGYGDPRERDPALVRADLRDELITAAEAEEVYGVAPGEGVKGAAGPGEESTGLPLGEPPCRADLVV